MINSENTNNFYFAVKKLYACFKKLENSIARRYNVNMVIHNIEPLFSKDSKTIILGSFPSVKSREAGFFYAHPQNRFWKVIAGVFGEEVPLTVAEKKSLILNNGLALYDSVYSCEISGSSDASMRNVVPSDLKPIVQNSKISKVFVNGRTAEKYYNKYSLKRIGIECTVLPSTSPANAAWSLERLIDEWRVIKL